MTRLRLNRKWRSYLFAYGFIAPAVIFFAVFVAYPSVGALRLSFYQWAGYGPMKFVGLRNYINLVQDPIFWLSLKNNVIFVIATTFLQTFIPLVLATLLHHLVSRWVASFFRVSYFVPNIVSFIISGALWAMILEPNFGLLNTILDAVGLGAWKQLWLADPKLALPSIIMVSLWQSMGFYLVIFAAGLQSIPHELYDAASVDGAGPLQRFRHVTIPLLRPVTTVVIVINVIGGFKVFDIVWAMTTGGPNHASEVLGTYLYTTAFGGIGTGSPAMGYAAAIGIAILALSLAASIMQIRWGGTRDLEY